MQKILHYAQLDHTTKKHPKLHQNWTTPFRKNNVYRHQTDRQTQNNKQRVTCSNLNFKINTSVNFHSFS